MRYTPEQRQATRAKMVAAALRSFRERGNAGVGVDALAKAAGVTSGAFYAHFKSKAEAFRVAISSGMDELREAIESHRASGERDWARDFVEFYFTRNIGRDLEDVCVLPTLTMDIARAEPEVRQAYQEHLREAVTSLAEGIPGDSAADRQARAWVMMALFAGGTALARAVEDPALRNRIARTVREAALVYASGDPE